MAKRLTEAFGSTPETWLGMRMAYDLWYARQGLERLAVENFRVGEFVAVPVATP